MMLVRLVIKGVMRCPNSTCFGEKKSKIKKKGGKKTLGSAKNVFYFD